MMEREGERTDQREAKAYILGESEMKMSKKVIFFDFSFN